MRPAQSSHSMVSVATIQESLRRQQHGTLHLPVRSISRHDSGELEAVLPRDVWHGRAEYQSPRFRRA